MTSDYSETGGGQGGYSSGYYISDDAVKQSLWNKGYYYDYVNALHFYPSNLRLDMITSSNINTYMAKFLTADKWAMSRMIIMYAHENQMFDYTNEVITSDYAARFTKVSEWAQANKFSFRFPMDKILNAF